MNKAKIFTILMVSLLAVVLISEFASAADPFKIVSAKWLPSGKQSETITFGDDIDFSVSVPYNRDMMGCYLMKARVSVTLYEKDSRQLIYSFLNEKLLTREEINKGFFATYHIDQNVYDNIGQYYVEVYKTESWMGCWYGTSDVKGLLTHRIYLDVEQAEEPTPVIPIPILSEPVTQVNENAKYSYQVVSMAKNGGSLFYELIESPDWLSMNKKTGVVGGKAPEVNLDTDYSIVIKVSERKCISYSSNTCEEYSTITSSTQHYIITVKDTNSPEPIDYYSCQQDSDCVKVQAGCCSCNYGGKNTAINKIYLVNWMSWINSQCQSTACAAVLSNDWTCISSEAKCVIGKCKLINTTPHEPVCGDGICESGEDCEEDCEQPEDDDHESDYDYNDVYNTVYMQEEETRKPAETINLVEPETLRAKKSCWQRFLEWIIYFFKNLF